MLHQATMQSHMCHRCPNRTHAPPQSRSRVSTVRVTSMSSTAKISVLEGLTSWLASKKVQTDKLTPVERLSDGKAVLASSREMPAGEVVLSVPEDIWLTPAAAQRVLKDVSGLEPWLQIALLLLMERQTPGSTPFSSYIRSLPQVLDSPLFWTPEQLSMLAGTQLMVSVEGYRAFFEAKHAELRPVFARLGLTGSAVTLESFLWAAATVRGRLHAPLEDEQSALVPGADAMSHRRRSNVTWSVRSASLFGRTRTLALETTRPVAQGEELCMDYGAVGGAGGGGRKLDSVVLLDYGVVDSQGLQPGYLLTLDLPESDRFIDDKRDILENSGMSQMVGPLSAAFELRPGQSPPPEMLGFLRLLHLGGGDAFLLESIFRQQAWGFMMDPVSQDNEAIVCQAMSGGAREALSGYPTSIEEDLAVLRSGTLLPGSREEMAVQVRLGEKEALDGVLSFFEDRTQNLKRLTYYQERRLRGLGLMDEAGRTTYDGFFKDGIA